MSPGPEARPPTWVIFDVNGTLLDPGVLDEALVAAPGLGVAVLGDAVSQSMTDALVGDYRPFAEYVQAALKRRVALGAGDAGRLAAALAAAARMPPYPEAAEALGKLRDSGFRLAALTNSPRSGAEQALEQAGLRGFFDELTGSDEVKTFKPAPQMYQRALAKQGITPSQAWMVAAHGWDLLGAGRIGLKTAWISRGEEILLETVPPPDVSSSNLLEAAELIASASD